MSAQASESPERDRELLERFVGLLEQGGAELGSESDVSFAVNTALAGESAQEGDFA